MASYYKDEKNGKWYVRFRETDLNTGTKVNKKLSGFKTKKEAQYAYEDHVTEYNEQREAWELNKPILPSAPVQDNLKFCELVAKFYSFKKSRIRDASFYDMTKKVDSRILPYFGNMSVKDINPATILDWHETIKDYSYSYQKTLYSLMSAIYSFGSKYHNVVDIMDKVDRPRKTKQKAEMQIYTPEEFAKFIKGVEKKQYAVYFTFLFLTGCRRGEALALNWNDIDLATGKIRINKSVAFKATTPNTKYAITPPKTDSSTRTIYIPDFFKQQLIEYQKWQAESCSDTAFVFGGFAPFPRTSIDREMRNAASNSGVKRIRIHDLRHSCASFLLHRGTSIVAVSRHLGHKNTTETLNTYAHMLPDDNTVILNNLNTIKDSIPTLI